MEEKVRNIMCSVTTQNEDASPGLGTDISRLFAKVGLESEVAELHGHISVPAVNPCESSEK